MAGLPPTEEPLMTHDGLHWLTTLGMAVFVLAACAILALSTATFAALWVGRGAVAPSTPAPPVEPGAGQ